MATREEFEAATVRIRSASGLAPDQLLKLYALFKQATVGDVTGDRPGMLDFKARAKYDAWAGLKGTSPDSARASYVALVDSLMRA